MDFLFGADMPLAVRFFFAFVIVLALIGGTAYLVRRFGGERLGASSSRGRQPRLAVIDAAAVDGRRRLILIRRDNVEHLLMIGGPTDVVVEANIIRAGAAAARDAGIRTPAAPEALPPRAAPPAENAMWPLQPEPTPAPAPRAPRQPVSEEPPWHPEPEPAPLPPQRRPEPRVDMRPEPRVAEPRALEPRIPEPRVAEPRISEPRMAESRMAEPRVEARPEPRVEMRPEPRMAADSRPEPRPADPLVGLAAELSRVQSESAAPPRPRPRDREAPRARAPQPERLRAVPPPPPSVDEPAAPNNDQNLAEMAQRLEAALRRPKPVDPHAGDTGSRPVIPMPAPEPEPMPPASDVAAHRDEAAHTPQPAPARAAAAAKPQRSVYDSLEQEMASLLGRPNSKI